MGATAGEIDTVVILDFGSQYSQLIARRVRELNVYSELLPFDTPWTEIAARKPKAVILSGGPNSVYESGSPHPDPQIWTAGVPLLGICYGLHLMAQGLGGEVVSFERKEFGPAIVEVTAGDGLFAGLDAEQSVWMSHGDSIVRLPDGFGRLPAPTRPRTPPSPIRLPGCTASSSTPRSFTPATAAPSCATSWSEIAGARQNWTPANFIASNVEEIRRRVDEHSRANGTNGKVLCALSGGVDSAVAATLVHRAVGDRLICVHVDHGMMRKNETELLAKAFEQLGVRVIVVNARERFLRKLAGVIDPEEKRRIIGNEFIRVFEEEATKLGRDRFPDAGHALPGRDRIGHVRQGEGGQQDQDPPQRRRPAGRHEVPADRAAAVPLQGRGPRRRHRAGPARLDGPAPAVPRPRPGDPHHRRGHAERLDTLREADWIVIDEIKAAGLYREIWQSFAILTPLRSVGVMGDGRTYANVVAIRAVTSEDAMTADWAKLPYDILGKISSRIVNEVPGVNRVVYDISSKPPATIEWE
jgi:GMP synthase (glutamine-hydrolysing)